MGSSCMASLDEIASSVVDYADTVEEYFKDRGEDSMRSSAELDSGRL